MLPNNERKRIKSRVVSTLNETLTSDHLTDKCPVPPEAINHADCNAPPAKPNKPYTQRLYQTNMVDNKSGDQKISEKYDKV